VLTEEMSFQLSFECCQRFCIPVEGGEIIPPATMNESDFVALCDGTTSRRSLPDHRLLVGMETRRIE